MGNDLLLLNTAATWALVGLIWTIQLVQYPGFARVGRAQLAAFHGHHCARITWVVAPLMGLELVSGALLLWERPSELSAPFVGSGLALIAVNWLATALVSAPLHGQLRSSASAVQRALVRTNWIRTAAWSMRGAWTLVALREVLVA